MFNNAKTLKLLHENCDTTTIPVEAILEFTVSNQTQETSISLSGKETFTYYDFIAIAFDISKVPDVVNTFSSFGDDYAHNIQTAFEFKDFTQIYFKDENDNEVQVDGLEHLSIQYFEDRKHRFALGAQNENQHVFVDGNVITLIFADDNRYEREMFEFNERAVMWDFWEESEEPINIDKTDKV